MIHNCTECGLAHEAPGPAPTSPEVEIARINAERDVKVAQLANRQEHDWNDTRVEVAQIEGDAQVATAEAEAEVIGEILASDQPADPEPIPVVVDADPAPDPEPDEPDVPAPPVLEDSGPPEPKAKARGMWAGYR